MFNNETKQILKSLLLSSTILFVTFDLIPLQFVRRTIDDISHTWDAYPGTFQIFYWVAARDRILPPLIIATILVGLILAGLFAATMSTADSQILSCSATITRDFTDDRKSSYIKTKLATLFVTIIALIIALSGTKSVFSLVIVAWSALACAFAPIMTIYVLGGKPSERLTICMVNP